MDSNYYGSSLSTVSAQMKFWIADHDFGYQICNAGYSDFFDFLAKVAMSGTTRRKSGRKTKGERSEQRLSAEIFGRPA